MRRAARKDVNQGGIVDGLRQLGFSVSVLNEKSVPDIMVGARGVNYLLEIKAPLGPRGGVGSGKLTPDQLLWYRDWKGQAAVVRTLDEALRIISPGPKVVICQGDLETVHAPLR